MVHIHIYLYGCTSGHLQYYRLVSVPEWLSGYQYKTSRRNGLSTGCIFIWYPLGWLTNVSTCTHTLTLGFNNRNLWYQICKNGLLVWTLFCGTKFWWLPDLHTALLSLRQTLAYLLPLWAGRGGLSTCAVLFMQQCDHMLTFCHWGIYLWEWRRWYCSLLACVLLPPGPVWLGHCQITWTMSISMVPSAIFVFLWHSSDGINNWIELKMATCLVFCEDMWGQGISGGSLYRTGML